MKIKLSFLKLIMFIFVSSFLLFAFRPCYVQGNSMSPTIENHQLLICNTLYNINKIECGDIVVIKPLICFNGEYVIKRVTQVTEDKVWLEGDNKEDSYDSRYVGWIDKANIFGKILFI